MDSAAARWIELRGVHDVINLASLFGFSSAAALNCNGCAYGSAHNSILLEGLKPKALLIVGTVEERARVAHAHAHKDTNRQHARTDTHSDTHTDTQTHTHTRTHAHTHTRTHAHAHTHTRIHRWLSFFFLPHCCVKGLGPYSGGYAVGMCGVCASTRCAICQGAHRP